MSTKRFSSRAAAIASYQLPFELLVPELFHLLAHDAHLSPASCSYVVDTRSTPEDFRVLNGSEGTTEALRALRAAGVWPAPSNIPSIERIVGEGLRQRVFAGPLWGEGCPEEGPWTPMWQERGVRHAYVLTAIAPSGLAAFGLFNCREGVPVAAPAMGEALSPIVAEILDRAPAATGSPLIAVKEAQLAFDADGKVNSLGVDCAETLRDAGGGGRGAVARMCERAEAAAKAILLRMAERPEPAMVGGPHGDQALRRGLFRLRESGPKPVARSLLATSRFGEFELTLAAAAEPHGGMRALGTIRQLAPRSVTLLRALIVADAPAREIELVRLLDEGTSVAKVAAQMGIAQSSAETLLSRLNERFAATARGELIEAMVEAGRTARC